MTVPEFTLYWWEGCKACPPGRLGFNGKPPAPSTKCPVLSWAFLPLEVTASTVGRIETGIN